MTNRGMALAHLISAMCRQSISKCSLLKVLSSQQDGFTLLEVVTVAAIIGIGAALAVPQFGRWNSDHQLQQAATEVQTQLTLARLAAMNRNRPVTVTFALVGGRVTISAVDSTGTQALPPATMLTHVTGVTGGPVQFNSLGLRAGGGGGNQAITVTNNVGTTYSVRVTPAGKSIWCPTPTPTC